MILGALLVRLAKAEQSKQAKQALKLQQLPLSALLLFVIWPA